MDPSLAELSAMLNNFIPLTKRVSDARIEALQKEAEALEKILARVWLVMPYIHDSVEPGRCSLINYEQRIPIGQNGGLSVRNELTLIEDGPRLVRSFTVERWGTGTETGPAFQIDDKQEISCLDAIKTYGIEDICAGLIDALKCNITLDNEYKELQSRIEKANSLVEVMKKKFAIECRQSEAVEVIS